jgi:hypothetical protein
MVIDFHSVALAGRMVVISFILPKVLPWAEFICPFRTKKTIWLTVGGYLLPNKLVPSIGSLNL